MLFTDLYFVAESSVLKYTGSLFSGSLNVIGCQRMIADNSANIRDAAFTFDECIPYTPRTFIQLINIFVVANGIERKIAARIAYKTQLNDHIRIEMMK